MAAEEILIPDIGNFDSVDVIDILMNIGDAINKIGFGMAVWSAAK